ncbi:hypothetical protein LTR66_003956 [Elasticomyces elasticus]|nr:hypothetical protein LTR66_003956 [Elasticomyces elasticus]
MSTTMKRYGLLLVIAACTVLVFYRFHDTVLPAGRSSFAWGHHSASVGQPLDSQDGHFRWRDVPVRYPVVSLTPLPTAKPKQLPAVQHTFTEESQQAAETRRSRLAAVKSTFERCWRAYKEHAWLQDELAPISGGYRNGFGGWAANLVDNLDNLWIMDMKKEFEAAVVAAVSIDLSVSSTNIVNVFETTIRHLGGLLSAYDLSQDQRLLHKATEVGEMLLVAFDTPNRMPITRWRPVDGKSGRAQVADGVVLVAEIGSLTLEFTRLSQVTRDPKWYDAVERIVRVFDEQQSKTKLPGMWPVVVNAKDLDFTGDNTFTLGAMSDSLYEYLPKMHALLGGVEPVYEKMYTDSMNTAITHNLWRPMTPDNADILLSGNVRVNPDVEVDPQGQHLVCFAGGMLALGGRLFSNKPQVELGRKLTNGCIWTYRALPYGIMPEVFHMVSCASKDKCNWDEDRWRDEVMQRASLQSKGLVDAYIQEQRIPKGFTDLPDRRYILRPEAIESVFILYRITGDQRLQDAGWDMFTAITNATETGLANAAISDVTIGADSKMDSMESFWMAETLKYFYLLFSEPSVISLDEWVFNTEAHPFKRPTVK